MTKQSAFDKKHVVTATLDEKRSFLEELNLPPAVIRFLQNNKNNLIIAAVCILVLIVAWTYYKNYTIAQNDKAAAVLRSAVKIEDETERLQAVKNVISEFSRTDAALWAKLELAHSDYQASNFEDAITKYKAILGDLSEDSSLVPLVTHSLAYSYEQLDDFENALSNYLALSKIPGFAGEGYRGAGRMYEKKNDIVNAIESNNKYLAFLDENAGGAGSVIQKNLILDKLAALKLSSQVDNKSTMSGETPGVQEKAIPIAEEPISKQEAETK